MADRVWVPNGGRVLPWMVHGSHQPGREQSHPDSVFDPCSSVSDVVPSPETTRRNAKKMSVQLALDRGEKPDGQRWFETVDAKLVEEN